MRITEHGLRQVLTSHFGIGSLGLSTGKFGYSALDSFFLLVSLHCDSEYSVSLCSNCQLAWIVAAILPLPKRPKFINEPARMMANEESIGRVYLPNSSVVNIAEMDEKIYQKARWWRVLNRIMVAPPF